MGNLLLNVDADKYLNITREIIVKNINKEKYWVFLFGSRANATNQYNSDVDVGVIGNQPLGHIYYDIKGKLEESIVPYMVELVDFSLVSNVFKNMVLQGDVIIWNQGKSFRPNFLFTKKQ